MSQDSFAYPALPNDVRSWDANHPVIRHLERLEAAGELATDGYLALAIWRAEHQLFGPAWAAIARAFEADATDPGIQRLASRLLPHAPEASRAQIRQIMLRYSADPETLINCLATVDPATDAVAWVQPSGDRLAIHVASRAALTFDILISNGIAQRRVALPVTAAHPLAQALGHAGAGELAWPDGFEFAALSSPAPNLLWINQLVTRPGVTMALRPAAIRGRPRGPVTDPRAPFTRILIPVYGQFEATRRCLTALFADGEPAEQREIVLIDDASPDPALRELIDGAVHKGAVAFGNPFNLGFIGSINRALRYFGDADTVLLNSDTVVPPRWLSRLRAVAASDPRIGTVTPRSNNGQTVSYPVPFAVNPMPSRIELKRLSDDLYRRHAGAAVDIPSGIGFCMFVTASCLKAVGLFDNLNLQRGYLEEVDFCLRASETGFRNVCAAGVYVAHEGGASFGIEKQFLAKRNAAYIRLRFPRHAENVSHYLRNRPLPI